MESVEMEFSHFQRIREKYRIVTELLSCSWHWRWIEWNTDGSRVEMQWTTRKLRISKPFSKKIRWLYIEENTRFWNNNVFKGNKSFAGKMITTLLSYFFLRRTDDVFTIYKYRSRRLTLEYNLMNISTCPL